MNVMSTYRIDTIPISPFPKGFQDHVHSRVRREMQRTRTLRSTSSDIQHTPHDLRLRINRRPRHPTPSRLITPRRNIARLPPKRRPQVRTPPSIYLPNRISKRVIPRPTPTPIPQSLCISRNLRIPLHARAAQPRRPRDIHIPQLYILRHVSRRRRAPSNLPCEISQPLLIRQMRVPPPLAPPSRLPHDA